MSRKRVLQRVPGGDLSLWRSPTHVSSFPSPAFSPFICFVFQEWATTRCSADGQNSLKRLQAPAECGPTTIWCSAPRTAPGTFWVCADCADSVNLETSCVWIALSRCPRARPLGGCMWPHVERRGCLRATAHTANSAPVCRIRK